MRVARCVLVCGLSLLAGLAPTTNQAAPTRKPVFVCQNGVCILNPAAYDSDGDGYSDLDERLAGTDPRNARSYPRVLQLIQRWQRGVPGLRDHHWREVIILPTTSPDGTAIGRHPLPDLPGRKDALSALGLDTAFLGGHDRSRGIRVLMDLRTPSKQAPASIRVNGMDARLLSAEPGVYGVSHSEEGGEVTEWFDAATGEKIGQDSVVHDVGPRACTVRQVCDRQGCSTSSECPPNIVMTDPDADPGLPQAGAILVATAEQIKAYDRKRGSNTTFGSTGVRPDPSAAPPGSNKSPIILINPDDDSVWLSTLPSAGVPAHFNVFGGNVNCGRPEGPSRPDLPRAC